MNYFTKWLSYIKSALEKERTSYLILKIIFFTLNCSMLYFTIFSIFSDYGLMIVSAYIVATIAVLLFLTSYIWDVLLSVELLSRIRMNITKNIHTQI